MILFRLYAFNPEALLWPTHFKLQRDYARITVIAHSHFDMFASWVVRQCTSCAHSSRVLLLDELHRPSQVSLKPGL